MVRSFDLFLQCVELAVRLHLHRLVLIFGAARADGRAVLLDVAAMLLVVGLACFATRQRLLCRVQQRVESRNAIRRGRDGSAGLFGGEVEFLETDQVLEIGMHRANLHRQFRMRTPKKAPPEAEPMVGRGVCPVACPRR